MDINLNQIISYTFYLVIMGIAAYIADEYKKHSARIIEIKQKEEKRAEDLLGQKNYEEAKEIVVDAVYKTEQLAKETAGEKWSSLDKHSKALEFISDNLQKAGLKLSDEDIYDIIKTTVGYINSGKIGYNK